jgi:hypothetical protein
MVELSFLSVIFPVVGKTYSFRLFADLSVKSVNPCWLIFLVWLNSLIDIPGWHIPDLLMEPHILGWYMSGLLVWS